MPAKKKDPESQRKPYRFTRIREALAAQVDDLAKRRATDFTEEVNRAVREMLEREGHWPPPAGK